MPARIVGDGKPAAPPDTAIKLTATKLTATKPTAAEPPATDLKANA
jgi:hypothetical protein